MRKYSSAARYANGRYSSLLRRSEMRGGEPRCAVRAPRGKPQHDDSEGVVRLRAPIHLFLRVRRERGLKHGVPSWLLQRGLQHTERL